MLSRLIVSVCALLLVFQASIAQVNLQTGSANFSLPMFEWKDDKSRLNALVALSYNSGNGLKVNDVASNVGQGWSLIAGGVITRMQVGEPDDQKAYAGASGGSESDISKYPNGYLYATKPAYDGCPSSLTKYPIYGHLNQIYTQHNEIAEDKQMDYFSFQFNGKSGLFVLDKINGDNGIPLGNTRLKITFQRNEAMANNTYSGTRTTITSFTIQDTDGLLYKFTRHGKTRVLQTNYCDKQATTVLSQPKFEANKVYYQNGFENSSYKNTWVIGSWHLTEIEDAFTHRKIFINYVDRTVNNIAGQEIAYNLEGNYSTVIFRKSYTISPEPTSIAFPDGHNVAFNYQAGQRSDLNGEHALASVDMTYNGRYISKYVLNTTYFILNRYGTPNSTYQAKLGRLCLRSVKKYGVDLKEDSPPHTFDYYLGSNATDDFVPPPFSFSKDIWGFYNGSMSTGYNNEAVNPTMPITELNNNTLKGLAFLHVGVTGVYLNPKAGYAKNGLLRQVIFPTGGTLSYEYGQNQYYQTSSNINVGGVQVVNIKSTDGGYSNGCANPVTTNYNFIMPTAGSPSSMWGFEMPVNSIVSYVHYHAEYKKFKWGAGCLFGCCYYKYTYPGIQSQNQAVSLTDFQKFMQAVSPVLNIISVVTTIIDVVNLVFYSSGVMAWVAVIVDIIGGLVTLAVTCFSSNQSSDKTNTTYYNTDLNGAAPLPAQFKRVEVVEGGGTNGKTVHEFTSDADYPLWAATNPNFSAKQRFAPWAYGLPKFITKYDALGNKLRQTENLYDNTYAKILVNSFSNPHLPPNPAGFYTNQVSCKCLVKKSYSQRNVDWANPSFYNASYLMSSTSDMGVDMYAMYTGRTELSRTYERTYKSNDPNTWVELETNYLYNFENFQVQTITTKQSTGDVRTTFISYSSEYQGGLYDVLNQNNVVALPIRVVNSVQNVATGDPNEAQMFDRFTNFTQLYSGDVRPSQILERRYTSPRFYWQQSAPDIPITTYVYNSGSNLIQVKDENNQSVVNIYDHNDKHIVSSTVNAEAVSDNPAYSSFETDQLGNWNLTGGAAAYVNGGITGSRSFNLASRTLTAALNSTKPYILSFWANNSNVVVNGGLTASVTAPTLNGFTYYEYSIPAGSSMVSLTGSANIDELRSYPKNSRMRTATYDPLIGKTSECDENNRIRYYEYDNLDRLRFIKDEAKNIVKMYEYNSVSKLNGCPGVYYSKLTTEYFTKSNCGTGYQGQPVAYTVPADKYTSTISQEDADAKVDYELQTQGQAFADAQSSSTYCKQIFYNVVHSVTVTSQSCPVGQVGGNVTYVVPAGKYSSLINVADANQMAQAELDANAQAYANAPATRVCSTSTAADWEWDNVTMECQLVSGQTHLFIRERDMNPNSPTYNTYRWSDTGVTSSCPTSGPCSFTPLSGLNGSNISFNHQGNQVYFELNFTTSSQWSFNNALIGNVAYSCRPSVLYTESIIDAYDPGREWEVMVYPNGNVVLNLLTGTAPAANQQVIISGGFAK